MRRIVVHVPLDRATFERLDQLARREARPPGWQAAKLLEHVLAEIAEPAAAEVTNAPAR